MASNTAGRELFRYLVAGNQPAPIVLVYGEESHLVEESIKAVTRAVLPDGGDEFANQIFTGGEVSGERVRQALETLSLFGGKRLIHVRNISQMSPDDLEAVKRYLDRPAPDTFLLMSGNRVDLRKRFFKAVKSCKKSTVVEFKPLYSNELPGWVQRQAANKKLTGVGSDLAHLIVDWTGPALSEMDSALDRLALFTADSGGAVTEKDVMALLDDTRSRTIFELTERLARRQLSESMDAIVRMLEAGEPAVRINNMIARHFRIVWRVKDGASRGLARNELASQAGCHPMFLGGYQDDARRFSEKRLRRVLGAIHDAERALKSSGLPDRLVLSDLAMNICFCDQDPGGHRQRT